MCCRWDRTAFRLLWTASESDWFDVLVFAICDHVYPEHEHDKKPKSGEICRSTVNTKYWKSLCTELLSTHRKHCIGEALHFAMPLERCWTVGSPFEILLDVLWVGLDGF